MKDGKRCRLASVHNHQNLTNIYELLFTIGCFVNSKAILLFKIRAFVNSKIDLLFNFIVMLTLSA